MRKIGGKLKKTTVRVKAQKKGAKIKKTALGRGTKEKLAKKAMPARLARKAARGAKHSVNAAALARGRSALPKPHAPRRPKLFVHTVLLGNAGVRSFLIDIAGENAINVLRDFREPASDEDLAKKTKMKVSDVRVVLNRLHSYGITEYRRSRDKDSGWYSYVWNVSDEKSREVLGPVAGLASQEKIIVSGGSGGEMYICNACGPARQFPFDVALNLAFRCDSCGGSLEFLEKKV